MALDTFIAGAYTHTYSGAATGYAQDGHTLRHQYASENIIGDYFGEAIIDTVDQNYNVTLEYISLAYKNGSLLPLFPNGYLGRLSAPGGLGSSRGAASILQSTAGTPAVASPTSVTAGLTVIANGAELALAFQSKLRRLPTRMQCLIYASGGNYVYYTLA